VIGRLAEFLKEKSLKARVARGGLWLGAGTVVDQGARFLRTVILARLLAREDFGLMAMALAASTALEAFTDVGIRQCVIQHKDGGERQFLNAAWLFSAVRGTVLFAIAQIVTVAVCRWMGRADLVTVIRIVSLSILFNALVSPRVYVLEKEMSFKQWTFLNQGTGLVGVGLTVVLAFFRPNAEALAIGFAAESALKAVGSYLVVPFRPRMVLPWAELRDIMKFAGRMAGVPVIMFFLMQADIVAVGKILGMDEVGAYSIAFTFASIPVVILSRVAVPLILPVFSHVKDDAAKLKEAVLLTTWCVGMLSLPVAALIAVTPRGLMTFFYGAAYGDTAVTLAVLAGYMLVRAVGPALTSVYMATGQPNLERRAMLVRAGILLVLIVPAVKYLGLVGAAGAQLVAAVGGAVAQLARIRRIVGFRVAQYLASMRDGALLALPVAAGGAVLRWSFPENGAVQVAGGTVILGAMMVIGAIKVLQAVAPAGQTGSPAEAAEMEGRRDNGDPRAQGGAV